MRPRTNRPAFTMNPPSLIELCLRRASIHVGIHGRYNPVFAKQHPLLPEKIRNDIAEYHTRYCGFYLWLDSQQLSSYHVNFTWAMPDVLNMILRSPEDNRPFYIWIVTDMVRCECRPEKAASRSRPSPEYVMQDEIICDLTVTGPPEFFRALEDSVEKTAERMLEEEDIQTIKRMLEENVW